MKKILFTLLIAFSSIFASVSIDGNLNEWKLTQKINLSSTLPLNIQKGDSVYGQYISSDSKFYIAIQTENPSKPIDINTTIWLNSDKNNETGYQIFGAVLGAEYYININTDGLPYLYTTEPYGQLISGPLEHSFNGDKTVLEIAIPTSLIGSVQNDLEILIDIADTTFIPSNYFGEPLKIVAKEFSYPIRTNNSKKVAIVYSKTTKEHFYDAELPIQKAYSQLFMTMQYHTMMAGLPFELLNEDDLTDISKLVNYDTIIFPSFSYFKKADAPLIKRTLLQAVYDYNIGIVTAGDFLTNYEDGTAVDGDSYANMKQLLGIGRVDGNGPASISLRANNITHPAVSEYSQNESIIEYSGNRWYSYYGAASDGINTQETTSLATQTINGTSTYDAVLASTTGGRNVHFSSLEFMGDTNLLWSTIQWSVFGNEKPVVLKLGRFNSLFVSRNDMDQSSVYDEVKANEEPLLNLLFDWKNKYNFVGSYYINIGNTPPEYYTDWNYSKLLYKWYIYLGNEIGTHSNTHPHDTNLLTPSDIQFEFNNSMDIIGSYLNPTWRDMNIRGGAVPGAPEDVEIGQEILKYLDYLTGGYSSIGAGYPGAFGYLTPEDTKVYLSPNMSFDFTLIEYGTPMYDSVTNTWYPQPLTPNEAKVHWENEFKNLTKHVPQAIVHWPWHDYGPTTSTKNAIKPYSVDMFTDTIKLAYNSGTEFLTAADLVQRIEAFNKSNVITNTNGDLIDVTVTSTNAGKLALNIPTNGKKIKRVNNWYAYNDNKIFLDKDAGTYNIELGTTSDNVTHISELPMRAELLSISGDGDLLNFSFKGEGKVRIKLQNAVSKYTFSGASRVITINSNEVYLEFGYGTHTVNITKKVVYWWNWWSWWLW